MKALFVLLLPLTLVLCLPGTGAAMVLTRRQVLSLVGSLPLTVAGARPAWTQTTGRVVVVGGGFGGVTCAKYLRRTDATLDVTLVEPHRQFVTCPFSNLLLFL